MERNHLNLATVFAKMEAVSSFGFTLVEKDKTTKARLGRLKLFHGEVETPIFMPVGSRGPVKTLTPTELRQIGVEMVLSNAYHLFLKPGFELIERAGGLNNFINWPKPILTDSGGYQVFSLNRLTKVTDEGVEFRSISDGTLHFFSPEKSIKVQETLGADVIMVLDQCPSYQADREAWKEATERSLKWAKRCQKAHDREGQLLFGIVQGGMDKDLRRWSAEGTVAIDFDGYALGGLSVGEPRELTLEITDLTTDLLPQDHPRYLMGLGDPAGLVEAVALGIDMFDSALPTRIARGGTVFTSSGKLNIRNAQFKEDLEPLDSLCSCYTCQNFSRAYLRHMFLSEEMLALRLFTLHNLYFIVSLLEKVRVSIKEGKFAQFKEDFLKNYPKLFAQSTRSS